MEGNIVRTDNHLPIPHEAVNHLRQHMLLHLTVTGITGECDTSTRQYHNISIVGGILLFRHINDWL